MNPAESLDDFLSRIEAHLGDLPAARRTETLAEARGHLEAMLAANRADGWGETAAWQKTARDFGDADQIGRDLAREWKRAPRVETVGASLTQAEKVAQIVRLVPWMIAGIGFFALFPWMAQHHLTGAFYLLMAPTGFLRAFWDFHHTGQPLNAESLFLPVLMCVVISAGGLQIVGEGTSWGMALARVFDVYLGPVFVAAFLVGAVWLKRGAKQNKSWRYLPRYNSNPIGAEEEYFNSTPGLLVGAVVGSVGGLMLRWQPLAWASVPWVCLSLLAVALLFRGFVVPKFA